MSNETNVLKQSKVNNFSVLGKLKSLDLDFSPSKKGKEMVRGTAVIQVVDGEKLNNIRVDILQMRFTSKGKEQTFYKGWVTLNNRLLNGELVTLENATEENPATRVEAHGKIDINDWVNDEGVLITTNKMMCSGIHSITTDHRLFNAKDYALLSVDMTITGYTPEQKDGIPTGKYFVEGFTIDYRQKIVEIKKMMVENDMENNIPIADGLIPLYPSGTTGKINLKINNYALVSEVQVQQPQHGFGMENQSVERVVEKFENNLQIVSGDLPYPEGSPFTLTKDEVEQAKKLRALQIKESGQSNAPATPQPNQQASGFGGTPQTLPTTTPTQKVVEDSDLPFSTPQPTTSTVVADDTPDF